MKIIVGIDRNGVYKPALDLIASLRFADLELTLMNAAPTESPIPFTDARMEAEYTKVVQNLGLAALDAAVDEACARGLKAQTKLVFGRAADSMVKEAALIGADLIALCTTHRGANRKNYMGSATWALVTDTPTPLLVAKGPIGRSNKLAAVLATSHSNESDGWIKRFIELAPEGISHLHVVSAYEVDDEAAAVTHRNLAMLGGDVDRSLCAAITEKTSAVARKLTEAGFETTFKVVKSSPSDAIREAMQETHGKLLIIGANDGARPSGSKIGSVALHELVAEDYPVLIVRS